MNTTSMAVCEFQVRRLSGHPRFPRDPVAGRELVKALFDHARSDAHAKRTVDALIESPGHNCLPDDITRAAWSLLEDDEKKPAGRDCPRCFGSGFVTVVRGGYEGAEPCPEPVHGGKVLTAK